MTVYAAPQGNPKRLQPAVRAAHDRGWGFDMIGREDLRSAKRPEGALEALTTDPSELGLRASRLDETRSLEDGQGLARAEDSDTRKARIHAALFEDRPLPPEHLGRFVLRGTLGQGGMGTVLEAYDAVLDRKVALKVLHPTLDERHALRLVREAQALAKLSHPNVVHVYEAGEVEGRTFIAMEVVHGRTLREWQEQERPQWRACVEAYLQAGQGLAAAHAAGLVHRDFKPGNCIIDADGRVRVLDFGLVRGLERAPDEEPSEAAKAGDERLAPTLTRTGVVLGTMAYMPIEQLDGKPVDARGDQFSFCVSLYEALYGERPFAGESLEQLAEALTSGTVRPAPASARVPGKLRSVLLRGLSADPSARWPSMTELLRELRHVVAPRIQVVSKLVKLVSVAFFWIFLIASAAAAFGLVKSQMSGSELSDDILYVTAYSAFVMMVSAFMFWHIAKLAALYEQGQLFTAANVRHLRTIGLLTTSLAVAVGLDTEHMRATLEFQPTPAVAGLLVVFVSWVIDEGRRLEERHQRTPRAEP
jgi:serine/threonine protein kinase